MIRRLLQVLPSWVWVVVVMAYLMLFGSFVAYGEAAWQEIRHFFLAPGCFLVSGYAVIRAGRFHPFYDPDYSEWLRRTPWNAQKRLPKGPFHLDIYDVPVPLALYLLALWHSPDYAFTIILFFAVGHGATHAYAGSLLKDRVSGYLFLYGLALVLCASLCGFFPTLAALVLIAVDEVCAGRILKRFPWENASGRQVIVVKNMRQATSLSGGTAITALEQFRLLRNEARSNIFLDVPVTLPGFPLMALRPDLKLIRIEWKDAFAAAGLAALISLVSYAAMRKSPEFDGIDFAVPVTLFAVVGAGVRLFLYKLSYVSPLSLAGRFATGQIIIPRHDVVFVAPLAAVIVGGLALTLAWVGVPVLLVIPITAALVTVVLLKGTPDLPTWHFLGHHRLRSPQGLKQVSVLQQI